MPGTQQPIGREGSYPKGVARRLEILDRAIDVFRERGADRTSLRSIGEALGISHAALLHYFDSREQLLVAVYEHAERRRDEEPSLAPDDTAVGILIGSAIANVNVPGLVQLYSALLAASLESSSEVGKQFFTTRFEHLRHALTERLAAEQARGTVRADVDPAAVAALIIGASDGLQIQWLLEPSIGLEETLRTFAQLLQP